MNPISPDARLSLIASMVKKCRSMADIGCDHAALPIYLVSGGFCSYALACDLRPEPLKSAEHNIKSFGLSDKIETRLSDGLSEVAAGEADEIVMAGMGGLLIADIIGRTPWLKDPEKGLVLQPMTHAQVLRRFLCENGFKIERERAASAAGHTYSVMRAVYRAEPTLPDQFFCYTGGLCEQPGAEEIRYLSHLNQKLKKRLNGLCAARCTESAAEISELREITSRLDLIIEQ